MAFADKPGGKLFNLDHDQQQDGAFTTLRFKTPQRIIHVEYYEPIAVTAPDRRYRYLWAGDLAVARLEVRLQEPAGASSISVVPELDAGLFGLDGLRYRTTELGSRGAGEPLSIEVRYAKRDARTSSELLASKAPVPERSPASGANEKRSGWLPALAIIAVLGLACLAVALWWRPRSTTTVATRHANRTGTPNADPTHPAWMLIFASWLIASIATLGALFFGEVMKVPTCALCWYQRIFMFPLVLILPAGLFPLDPRVVRYALPLSIGGWAVALFHVLVVAGFIPEKVQPCTQGIPCSETHIQWLGFITIPLLALVAFTVIIALLAAAHFKGRT